MAYTDFYGFIDADYIKENSTIDSSFGDEKILPFVIMSQEKWVLPILGTELYNDLQASVKDYLDNGTPISDDYRNLINNYIKNLQLHYCIYEMLPFIQMNMTNIAVSKKNSEFSTPASMNELTYLRNSVRATAQYYGERLENHLKEEALTKYPKYYQVASGTDSEPPVRSESKCGIYLGTSKRKGYMC